MLKVNKKIIVAIITAITIINSSLTTSTIYAIPKTIMQTKLPENKNTLILKELVKIKNNPTIKLVEKPMALAINNKLDNEKEREDRIVKEYYKNKFLKEALDAYANYKFGLGVKMRTHERRVREALDFAQKLEIAKNSGTVSKEALDFIDEKIKELNPLYAQLVNEGKNKEAKEAKEAKKQEKLVKTGSSINNIILTQISVILLGTGGFLIKKFKK